MQWYETIFELIDMRSFSNLWFWIMLAVQWSMTSHWVLGVPFDLVLRARRTGGQAQEDLEAIARVNVNRLLYITHVSGLWIAGFIAFILTLLIVLGFFYGIEFAQAAFCLFFPMVLVSALAVRTAHKVADGDHQGEALMKRLVHLRMGTQFIGMIAILLTSLWGMYQNMHIGVLG
ncbi:component of SufBCD complex [Gemmobacter lutimaris]|uniref:Component of SufBCD complex n=1 Tax=Gemmobacter lutimaris TaxID=2306023 RepID=A0A398BLG7_9RHOB|nr:component of SufBCD complex [Gemmobacter lutimaris]RID91355.1 component of SufBCD complex [Gemmobacter lutimaris]